MTRTGVGSSGIAPEFEKIQGDDDDDDDGR